MHGREFLNSSGSILGDQETAYRLSKSDSLTTAVSFDLLTKCLVPEFHTGGYMQTQFQGVWVFGAVMFKKTLICMTH